VSSTYRAICLGHDPAIELDPEWNDPETALAAVTDRTGPLETHQKCDLLIGRYSSPIVELGCPAGAMHPGLWHPHRAEWIDAGWLRLVIAAVKTDDPRTLKAAGEVRGCWRPGRVVALRGLLAVEDEYVPHTVSCEDCREDQ